MMRRAQALHLLRRFPEYPIADFDDHARFFRQQDELCRVDQAARRDAASVSALLLCRILPLASSTMGW